MWCCKHFIQADSFELVTCCQLTVSKLHTDVVQSYRAAVPEAPAGADEDHLCTENKESRGALADVSVPVEIQQLLPLIVYRLVLIGTKSTKALLRLSITSCSGVCEKLGGSRVCKVRNEKKTFWHLDTWIPTTQGTWRGGRLISSLIPLFLFPFFPYYGYYFIHWSYTCDSCDWH